MRDNEERKFIQTITDSIQVRIGNYSENNDPCLRYMMEEILYFSKVYGCVEFSHGVLRNTKSHKTYDANWMSYGIWYKPMYLNITIDANGDVSFDSATNSNEENALLTAWSEYKKEPFRLSYKNSVVLLKRMSAIANMASL